MTERVAILGAGAMGTACAAVLGQSPGHSVRLWARNATFARHIDETRENSRLLPGIQLSPLVVVTADPTVALRNATVVIVCVPTRGIRSMAAQLGGHIDNAALLVSAVKGIENETLKRPSQMLQELLGDRSVVALGGPCHAEEVAVGRPTTVVAASEDLRDAERVQQLMSNDTLRVYSNSDLAGVELGGALKNVIAIAAGIGDGLNLGDNARAALMTRGLAEMVRFGTELGAVRETFYGLAGIGDLVVTCGSQHSRNRRVGELLGQGRTLEFIQHSMHAVAEGVFTARSVISIAEQNDIDMPIAREVHRVLFENKAPREATEELMNRPLREE